MLVLQAWDDILTVFVHDPHVHELDLRDILDVLKHEAQKER